MEVVEKHTGSLADISARQLNVFLLHDRRVGEARERGTDESACRLVLPSRWLVQPRPTIDNSNHHDRHSAWPSQLRRFHGE